MTTQEHSKSLVSISKTDVDKVLDGIMMRFNEKYCFNPKLQLPFEQRRDIAREALLVFFHQMKASVGFIHVSTDNLRKEFDKYSCMQDLSSVWMGYIGFATTRYGADKVIPILEDIRHRLELDLL